MGWLRGLEIVLLLIEKHGGMWMRKEIPESMGPCFYDCPVSFLERAPFSGGGKNEAWRQLVRERRARLNPGI